MTADPVRDLVILGGGTAGWMMAAAAQRFLDDGQRRITLIESDAIGTVGVGEATIPPILSFNKLLGIDEAAFLRATGGTFKLGIEFVGWDCGTDRYFHPFGTHGRDFEGIGFHQLWLKLRREAGTGALNDYSPATVLARGGRFAHPPTDARAPFSGLAYAYHFDAGLYAAFLRERAEAGGVVRVEGEVASVRRHVGSGDVAALRLTDGREIAGDLFVDCSGFRSLLLGEAMGVDHVDWSRWLPCDRALAVPTERRGPLLPYTRATAHRAGWQWRIPLQHRTGNGVVYSSAHMSDEEAEQLLLAGLDAPATAAPKPLRFRAGRRTRFWEGNVVALGLSAGFLEPLESTSIHLIQTGISKLLALFPDRQVTEVERDEYNRLMADSYDGVRDFLILHYHANRRTDSDFWRDLAAAPPPSTLARKIELFRTKGRVFRQNDELFVTPNWVSVMLGQNIVPRGYDPVVDALDAPRVAAALRTMREGLVAAAHAAPPHEEAIKRLGGQMDRP